MPGQEFLRYELLGEPSSIDVDQIVMREFNMNGNSAEALEKADIQEAGFELPIVSRGPKWEPGRIAGR